MLALEGLWSKHASMVFSREKYSPTWTCEGPVALSLQTGTHRTAHCSGSGMKRMGGSTMSLCGRALRRAAEHAALTQLANDPTLAWPDRARRLVELVPGAGLREAGALRRRWRQLRRRAAAAGWQVATMATGGSAIFIPCPPCLFHSRSTIQNKEGVNMGGLPPVAGAQVAWSPDYRCHYWYSRDEARGSWESEF